MIYKFGERLTEISQEEWEKEKCPAVFQSCGGDIGNSRDHI